MADYKHGTYGEFSESVGGVVAETQSAFVYVGTAPVNLIRGYAGAVNMPILLRTFDAAKRLVGYSDDWATFTLCEAIQLHFDNASGNIGPMVVINALDPAVHKKAEETNQQLTFANGRATIQSDTIILDTLVLADKVEGVDFSIDYDFTKGQVIINSLGAEKLTGQIQATFSEIDLTSFTEDDIIGGVTAGGVYTGLGCVGLVYPEIGRIPSLIAAPGWSDKPKVYEARSTATGTPLYMRTSRWSTAAQRLAWQRLEKVALDPVKRSIPSKRQRPGSLITDTPTSAARCSGRRCRIPQAASITCRLWQRGRP